MASCNLGASNIKIPALGFNQSRAGSLLKLSDRGPWLPGKPLKYVGLSTSHQVVKAIQTQPSLSVETSATAEVVKESNETEPSGMPSQRTLYSSQVESLIHEICNTSIVEFELKSCGMELHVFRDLSEKPSSPRPQAPTPAPVSANTASDGPATNGSASSHSLAIVKPASSLEGAGTTDGKVGDEGLATLRSPKVGLFRRSRIIKGKRMPPPCEEKQAVKEGQVLCYIEQLGGQIPIESDVSGEVVKILRDDGEPVGYNDALMTILPSFPGIKKLQ